VRCSSRSRSAWSENLNLMGSAALNGTITSSSAPAPAASRRMPSSSGCAEKSVQARIDLTERVREPVRNSGCVAPRLLLYAGSMHALAQFHLATVICQRFEPSPERDAWLDWLVRVAAGELRARSPGAGLGSSSEIQVVAALAAPPTPTADTAQPTAPRVVPALWPHRSVDWAHAAAAESRSTSRTGIVMQRAILWPASITQQRIVQRGGC
jgi:hypothetical protein